MRYLIVSDVHANWFGLEAVLKDAENTWDKVLCLGDVVVYGAHPNECCESLRALDAHLVMGNHDAAAVGYLPFEEWNEVATSGLHWTRDRLSKENWRWLAQGSGAEIFSGSSEGLPFVVTHGNLEEPFYETYILSFVEAFDDLERLSKLGVRLGFFGHTHRAVAYRLQLPLHTKSDIAITSLPHGGEVAIDPDALYLINPGSCGQPRDKNPQVRYALFDSSTQTVRINAVAYDVAAARAAIYQAGLSSILGDRLLEGW